MFVVQAPVTPTATDAASGLAATSGASSVVVLQLEVLFDQQHDRLLLQPHAQEFQDALDRWLHGVEGMVRDVPQLMQNAQLQVRYVGLFEVNYLERLVAGRCDSSMQQCNW